MADRLIRQSLEAFYGSDTLAEGYANALRGASSYCLTPKDAGILRDAVSVISLRGLSSLPHPSGWDELRFYDAPWTDVRGAGALLRRRMTSVAFARVQPEREEREMGVETAYVFHEQHELAFAQHINATTVYLTGAILLHEDGSVTTLDYPHVQRSHPDFALAFEVLEGRDAARVEEDANHRREIFRTCLGLLIAKSSAADALREIADPHRPPTRQQQRSTGYVERPHYALDLTDNTRKQIEDAARKLRWNGEVSFDLEPAAVASPA